MRRMTEKRQRRVENAPHSSPVRLVALTDGLFATVLTVLVLDLRVPDAISASNGDVRAFLRWLGPHLLSFLLTFLVAGAYWSAHHRDFELVLHTDRRLLSYNLLFLLFIGLLPFSTASLSLGTSTKAMFDFYWAVYALNLILGGLMLTLTWAYAYRHGLVDPRMSREQNRLIVLRRMITPVAFLISIGAEYLIPRIALGPFTLLLIPLAQAWVDRRTAQVEPKEPPSSALEDLLWRAGSFVPWAVVMGVAAWAMSL